MLKKQMDEVNTKAILHHGIKLQSVVCMEELAELTKEVSKFIRGSGSKSNLTEEMADVYICLDQLRKMYNVDPEQLQDEIYLKLCRTQERLEKYKGEKYGTERHCKINAE